MKALSIRQPWAFAIVMGAKPVENRDWPTRFRGRVLIHTGKKEERDDVDYVVDLYAKQAFLDRDEVMAHYQKTLVLGAIVGIATLVDCVTAMDSQWFFGPYGFVFEAAQPIMPVRCRGALGFFNAPPEVLAELGHSQ